MSIAGNEPMICIKGRESASMNVQSVSFASVTDVKLQDMPEVLISNVTCTDHSMRDSQPMFKISSSTAKEFEWCTFTMCSSNGSIVCLDFIPARGILGCVFQECISGNFPLLQIVLASNCSERHHSQFD